jgi:hypothetical protein
MNHPQKNDEQDTDAARPPSFTVGDEEVQIGETAKEVNRSTTESDKVAGDGEQATTTQTSPPGDLPPAQSHMLSEEQMESTMKQPAELDDTPSANDPEAMVGMEESRRVQPLGSDGGVDTKVLLQEILVELKDVGRVLKRPNGERLGRNGASKEENEEDVADEEEEANVKSNVKMRTPLHWFRPSLLKFLKGKEPAQSLSATPLDESDQSDENENPSLLVEERKKLYDHDLIELRRKPATTDFDPQQQAVLTTSIGDLWCLPFDGRVLFHFQKRSLLARGFESARDYLKEPRDAINFCSSIAEQMVIVDDIGIPGQDDYIRKYSVYNAEPKIEGIDGVTSPSSHVTSRKLP